MLKNTVFLQRKLRLKSDSMIVQIGIQNRQKHKTKTVICAVYLMIALSIYYDRYEIGSEHVDCDHNAQAHIA